MAPGTPNSHDSQFYFAGFDASWELDLFGGSKRALEAASAEAGVVNADYADNASSFPNGEGMML